MRVISQLPKLMAEKQMRENRIINAITVSRETGLSRPTIASWIKTTMTRYDEETIVIFCKYFDCDVCDLLKLDKGNEE
jgi:hypothetical protein